MTEAIPPSQNRKLPLMLLFALATVPDNDSGLRDEIFSERRILTYFFSVNRKKYTFFSANKISG